MDNVKSKMHAAVLHGPMDLRLEQVDRPIRRDDEALVRIAVNGLCGSDIHFYKEGRLGPFVVDRPYIPGHEAVGAVVEIGDNGFGLSEGDRVTIEPGIACRKCRYCKSGRYNLCPDVTFLSAPPVNGTFAEYIAVPWDFLFKVPDSLPDEEAALVEPLSVGIQACNRASLKPGMSFAVIGAGPIGLITYLAATAYGAGPGIVLDIQQDRLDFAQSLGAFLCIDTRSANAVEATLSATEDGVDVVFDCTGSSQACGITPKLAVRGGVVVVVGWPELPQFPFPMEIVLEKELDVRGVNRYCNTYPIAIKLLAERRVNLGRLISHRFTFESVVDAFRFASENPSKITKVVVTNTP